MLMCTLVSFRFDEISSGAFANLSVASVVELTFGPGDFRLLCNHWGCKEGPSVPLGESAQGA